MDDEAVGVRAYQPHEEPTVEQQPSALRGLEQYFAKIDQKPEDAIGLSGVNRTRTGGRLKSLISHGRSIQRAAGPARLSFSNCSKPATESSHPARSSAKW